MATSENEVVLFYTDYLYYSLKYAIKEISRIIYNNESMWNQEQHEK